MSSASPRSPLPLTRFDFQRLLHAEIEEIDNKIAHLNDLRQRLEEDLLKLHEEDLELQEERALNPSCTEFFVHVLFP